MNEKNIISASEGSRIQAAGVNNLCNVLQGGPINGNSQTNSVSANNYYIGSGETPGVGKPYKDGDEITLKAQSGEEFSAKVDLSEPGGSINVDNYARYNEANYDPDNIETKTALCAVPNVAAQTGYDFLEGTCDVEGWLASHYWKDEEAAQYWKDTKEGFTKEAQEAHEFYKSFAPNKELFDVKTKDGMLMVDMAMMASLAKDGVVLSIKGVKFLKSVKTAGKMPKSIEELRAILMRCFGKGAADANNRTEMYAKLRNETQRELEEWLKIANDPKNKSLSKNQLRPALSASYNTKTGNYFYAKNLTKDEVIAGKTVYHPYVNDRIMTMDEEIYEVYKDMTHGAGSHAECLTLNESMLNEFCTENNIERSTLTQEYIDNLYSESPELFNQDPHDTIINVVNSTKLNNTDLATAGNPMPRCPHCKYVTFEADVLDEVSQAEIDLYSKKYPDLKFDK